MNKLNDVNDISNISNNVTGIKTDIKPEKKYKGLLLASGGIDSPVAGYLMIKKGVDVIAIHFSNEPFIDKRSEEKTHKLVNSIGIKKLIVIPHGKNQSAIMRNCNVKFQCVMCRRFMFRIAEKIAEMEGCDFLITGENMGQVASQTLKNLATTDSAVKIPILRPVLGYDKVETINIARKIGTFELSILPGMCCAVVPPNPATWSMEETIIAEEEKIDVNKLVEEAVAARKLFEY